MKKALYSTILEAGKVRCDLCPHNCVIAEDKSGICLTRQNINGELIALNYCRPVSIAIDPIEKKPLYHFLPGSQIFSTGPNGCNFKCRFCQNWEISQKIIPSRKVTPQSLVEAAVSAKSIGIAYTYSEPYIWFETIMETGPLFKSRGLKNVLVTNGFMEHAPLMDLLGFIDAMNIDIKSIRPGFYEKLCNAKLKPVLTTCETAKKMCHIEITNLIIPGENDSVDDIRGLTDYIAANLGKDTPLHFSRYFPRYKMTSSATEEKTLLRAWEIAREKLDYVYVGNIETADKSNTNCPSCGKILVQRNGYNIKITPTADPLTTEKTLSCPSCGFKTNIVLS
jgi:pyruvate formate lyase activating enzyme